MASKFLNNLSNTYQQSPSLQNQFTEQGYLDLFGNQKTTPAMAKAFNIDDYEFEDEGIKSIINTATPIINQTGSDSVPTTGRRKGFSTQGAPYGNAPGGIHNDDEGIGSLGYRDALGLIMGGPFGYAAGKIGKWAFKKAKTKFNDWSQKTRERKEKELQAEINSANEAAANRARVEAYTGRPMSEYRQSRPRSEQGFTGHGKSGMGRDPDDKMAKGGRVGAKDGGSMIQIVKDRLMEKNPAMWGIGYEGLASLQDLIMSMPFNQGGIVNIRRK